MSTQGLRGPNGFAQLFGAIGPVKGLTGDFPSKIGDFLVLYPLVNLHSYGKSTFLMGTSTINDNFQ
jgi:hypothetical protein